VCHGTKYIRFNKNFSSKYNIRKHVITYNRLTRRHRVTRLLEHRYCVTYLLKAFETRDIIIRIKARHNETAHVHDFNWWYSFIKYIKRYRQGRGSFV